MERKLTFVHQQATVVFTQAPADRPYGLEAIFRDDSGNWFSLTHRTA
jgi:hypothetical protein